MEIADHEFYVSLEVAKLLKEAGFDWETKFGQHIWDKGKRLETNRNFNSEKYVVSLPTLEVAQRWLREVKKYYVSVVADCDSVGVFYFARIIYYDTNNNYYATYVWDETNLEHVKHWKIFNNYEEAFEAGIKKALEIFLEKGE